MMKPSGVLPAKSRRTPSTFLEDPVWRCPCCGKEFQRRFISPEELRALFGCSGKLNVELEGPDARRQHLETHTTGGERRKPPHAPRRKYPPRARNNTQSQPPQVTPPRGPDDTLGRLDSPMDPLDFSGHSPSTDGTCQM
jgi:hypothetical protein